MNFRKTSKEGGGGGDHFQSKNLCCRFWTFIWAIFGCFPKKLQLNFPKMRGGVQGRFPKIHQFWYPDPSLSQITRKLLENVGRCIYWYWDKKGQVKSVYHLFRTNKTVANSLHNNDATRKNVFVEFFKHSCEVQDVPNNFKSGSWGVWSKNPFPRASQQKMHNVSTFRVSISRAKET